MAPERKIPGQALHQDLRYQAPPEITSLSSRAPIIDIVNLAPRGGQRRFTEEQARQRNKEARRRYAQSEQGRRKKAEADKRYWQSDKGKATFKRYTSKEEAKTKNAANKRLQRQRRRLSEQ